MWGMNNTKMLYTFALSVKAWVMTIDQLVLSQRGTLLQLGVFVKVPMQSKYASRKPW